MPVLKNARHEKFAQGLFKGKTADKAYVDAGFKPHDGNAARLRGNERIVARVAELQSKVAEKAEWSAADRLLALKGIFDKTAKDDPRVAISAISEANKMQGSYAPVKREHSGPNGGPIEYANMTEEEIDARIAALAVGAGEDEPEGEA
jgi:phage terminase small subunit